MFFNHKDDQSHPNDLRLLICVTVQGIEVTLDLRVNIDGWNGS